MLKKTTSLKLLLAFLLLCTYSFSILFAQKNGNGFIRQASKDLANSNFIGALENSVLGLQNTKLNKKRKKEGLEMLERCFPVVSQIKTDLITKTKKTAQRTDFTQPYIVRNIINNREKLEAQYSEIQALHNSVKNALIFQGESIHTWTFKDYSQEIQESSLSLKTGKKQAGVFFYELGNKEGALLTDAENEKEPYRRVALYYKQAWQYDPSAPYVAKAKEQYSRFRKLGTKRIGIAPFENKSSKDQYGAISEQISDEITSRLFNNRSDLMEFTQIVSREHIRQILEEAQYFDEGIINDSTGTKLKELYGIDELITGKITQISSFKSEINRENFVTEREVKVGVKEVKTSDGKTKKENVYENRSIPYTKLSQEAGAEIIGSYMIVDMSNAEVIRQQAFNKSYDYRESWINSTSKFSLQVYDLKKQMKEETPTPPFDTERVNLVVQQIIGQLMDEITIYISSQSKSSYAKN